MPDLDTFLSGIKPYWDALNNFLDIPVVQFVGLLVIAWLLSFIKSVRRFAGKYWSRVYFWLKDSFLIPHLYPALGIASSKDLSELQKELMGSKEKSGNNDSNLSERTIERLNLKVALGKDISRYLGQMQPSDIGPDTIHSLLQGPFCPQCNRNLLFDDRSGGGIFPVRTLRVKCPSPNCTWVWPYIKDKTASTIPADRIKNEIYERLDAEFRRTGGLSDVV